VNAIVKHTTAAQHVSLRPQTFAELFTFAERAARSGMVPSGYIGKPDAIVIAVQMGSELGLAPMQAINSIAVVNGRPSVFGDALIGICRASPVCQDIIETLTGEGDAMEAVCVAKRAGSTPVTARFTMADAKKAGLVGKSGPWSQYPKRMLQMRARGFALRDAFPDVLRGLITAEEAADIPPDTFTGTTIDAAPPSPTPQREAAYAAPTPRSASVQDAMDDIAREVISAIPAKLALCHTVDEVQAIADMKRVKRACVDASEALREEIGALLSEAMARVMAAEADMEGAHEPETVE
jgi:hypothetical protein